MVLINVAVSANHACSQPVFFPDSKWMFLQESTGSPQESLKLELILDKKVFQEGEFVCGAVYAENISPDYHLQISAPANSFLVSNLAIILEKNVSKDVKKKEWKHYAQTANYNRGNMTDIDHQYQGMPLQLQKGEKKTYPLALNLCFVELDRFSIYPIPVFLEAGNYRARISYLNFEARFPFSTRPKTFYGWRPEEPVEGMKAGCAGISFQPVPLDPVEFWIEKDGKTPEDGGIKTLEYLAKPSSDGPNFLLDEKNAQALLQTLEKGDKAKAETVSEKWLEAVIRMKRSYEPADFSSFESIARGVADEQTKIFLADLIKVMEGIHLYWEKDSQGKAAEILGKVDTPDAGLILDDIKKRKTK